MALKGLFQEATAENDEALQRILKEYESVLAEDPTNMVMHPSKPVCYYTHSLIANLQTPRGTFAIDVQTQ
jgi:hypothetical protein